MGRGRFVALKSTGTNVMASVDKTSKSKGSSTSRSAKRRAEDAIKAKFVVCIETGDYSDLQLRKIYRVTTDRSAAAEGYIRLVDESGEDYLYPANWFVPVPLSATAAKAVRAVS